MRIASQSNIDTAITKVSSTVKQADVSVKEPTTVDIAIDDQMSASANKEKKPTMEEKVTEAIDYLNDFLKMNQKASKFVKHEGLDKYYVRLVDVETEEVIREIPPESLLNAFYEMKKLAGMIVDEKI